MKPLSTRPLRAALAGDDLAGGRRRARAESSVWQSEFSPGMRLASTTGVGGLMPCVIVHAGLVEGRAVGAARCSVEVKTRFEVEAPTVVTHGPP